ncbi:MAG: ImmA/IrrE family metallo-endopeptidase [Propionibacteriaceae bacterium]|nr:ImmA/IrrE family metallo-endopeptidase [Propionibacteriaceae bacterium]
MSGGLKAIQAAAETLDRLALDQSQPIDIYDAIDRCGLFLSFSALDGILGASLPQLHGVLVTTRRSPAIQRYTAAHELAHCVLHEDLMILDEESQILESSPAEQEQQAQLFASAFLMPPELVFRLADQYRIHPDSVTPAAVGQAARDMRVSFEAAARRLQQLERITYDDLDRVMAGRSRWRREALFGVPPVKGAHDVWGVRASSRPTKLTVTVGDQVTILFPENRTTGYQWIPSDPNAGDEAVRTVGDEFRIPRSSQTDGDQEPAVGQQGERVISLMPVQPGKTTRAWRLVRPFDPEQSIAEFTAELDALPAAAEQRRLQLLSTALDSPQPSPVQFASGDVE